MGEEAVRRMTWTAFRELFLENYFPPAEKIKKQKEFLELTQGNQTVREYTVQFERLSRFASHMVDTPEKKNQRYHQGLNLRLQQLTLSYRNQNFKDLVGSAKELEDMNQREFITSLHWAVRDIGTRG